MTSTLSSKLRVAVVGAGYVATHHLAALSRAGLVRQERRGREVICTAAYERVNALAAYLTEACCTGLELPSCGQSAA